MSDTELKEAFEQIKDSGEFDELDLAFAMIGLSILAKEETDTIGGI